METVNSIPPQLGSNLIYENIISNSTSEARLKSLYPENNPMESRHDDSSIQYSFVTVESIDENDLTNEEIADITEGHEVNPSDDMAVYEVVSEYTEASNPTQAINSFPHIFIKLCDGAIINAENGECIINLYQFMTAN